MKVFIELTDDFTPDGQAIVGLKVNTDEPIQTHDEAGNELPSTGAMLAAYTMIQAFQEGGIQVPMPTIISEALDATSNG
jgi:hypothetical protein